MPFVFAAVAAPASAREFAMPVLTSHHVRSWLCVRRCLGAATLALFASALPALAQPAGAEVGPGQLVSQISSTILASARADPDLRAGDLAKLTALVDAQVMPHVDFQRMTASAVGHYWRGATQDQKARLQEEFKSLLLHVYSGALAQVTDQTIEVKPRRSIAGAAEVIVRTVVRGRGADPIRLDYRLALRDGSWKIYDISVLGVWLALNYRSSFTRDIRTHGIDGLLLRLGKLRETR